MNTSPYLHWKLDTDADNLTWLRFDKAGSATNTLSGGVIAELSTIPGLELALPDGGMYAFFRLPGHTDDVLTAKRLVAEAGLGLAPGSAFAPEAQGWLRWCFASKDQDRLGQGAERLRGWLGKL